MCGACRSMSSRSAVSQYVCRQQGPKCAVYVAALSLPNRSAQSCIADKGLNAPARAAVDAEWALAWLVQAHMRAVSPCFRRVMVRSLRTAGGAFGLLPQRTSSVMPRSRMYRAKLSCRVFGLQT